MDTKDTIILNVNQFINLYHNIKHEQESCILNRMTISEILTKIINDKSGMMFDSWCNNFDVMN